MEKCKRRFEFFLDMDLFGKEPNLYFEKKKKKTSIIGLLFTIIYIIIYIVFFIYKLVRMSRRIDVTFYDTYAYKDFPSIKLTNEEFYGGFSMGGIIDETLYYATAQFVSGVKIQGVWNYTYRDLEVETCKLEKFGTKYRELFKDQPLNNLYCMKNVDFTLEGYANLDRFSYINVKVFPCVNTTRDGKRKCQDQSKILKFFASNVIEFKMEDNLLSPELYKTPVEPQRKDINAPVFLTVYQKIYSYIQIVYIETDNDITGLNFLSENKVEQYPKYDNSMLIAAPGSAQILQTGGPVCDITMQLHQKILTTRRKYTTLLEVLGDVGGLMELIYTFFNLICSFLAEIAYEKNLVDNLFSFDLKKKVIILNHYKKKENFFDSAKSLTKMDSRIEKNSLTELKKYNAEIYSKEVDNKNNQKSTKPYHKSKKRQKSKYTSKPLNNNIDIYNEEKKNNKDINNIKQNSNNIYMNNIYNRNEPDSNEIIKDGKSDIDNGNNFIDKIEICPLCLFCLNKKKNIKKVLFEEGNEFVSTNLDIMNIFDKLFLVEKMQKNLNLESNYIEMSEKCKHRIDNIRNNLYKI